MGNDEVGNGYVGNGHVDPNPARQDATHDEAHLLSG